MRTNDSLRKKSSSKSSSSLPPKTSFVPPPVPVTDPTQVFIPRDNGLVQSTDWSIQASPAVSSSELPSNWTFNRLIETLSENGGNPSPAYPNSRTSAPQIQPQTLPSDEVGLVQPAKESPGEINQVKSTPHVELGNKTVGTHPPHRQADIDSSQINERSNQQQVAQGVSYLGGIYLGDIELPNLPEKDPNFTWELLVKVLVEIFKFPSREYAEDLLKYLGKNQYPIRISYSIIIHTSNPDHEVLAIYAENQDAVSFYQKEANQALNQASSQAIQREYINPLNQFNSEIFNVATRENYIGELNQLSPEIRTQLNDFFNNLQETIKKDIENKATEIYGQVATIDDDVALYEAIIIQVLYEKFPTEFENIISGEVETPESPSNSISDSEPPFNIFNINPGATPEINIPIFDLPSGDNQPSEITISEQKITIPISELPFDYKPPEEITGQIPTTNPGNNPASDSGQSSTQTTEASQRAQLENLSPEIQSLLGINQSLPLQLDNYEQLLNIGGNLQGFSPQEIQSYQVARERFNWDINQLQGSVNAYITVRDRLSGELQGQEYKQTLDSLLFGENSTPEASKIDWWQLFKDLIASTLGSYKYAPEVLGELWAEVKGHWPLFVGTIVGLFVAEKLVLALAVAPEPTFLTKVLAVAIQSAIIAIYGVSIVVEGGKAAVALAEWFTTASEAKGNPDQIEVAAKAFLRGIGHLLLVILGSLAFQAQINPDRLAALKAMLGRVRGQGTLRLPDGTPTIDLYPDPDHPGSYVFRTSPQPNPGGSGGNLLPPSSRPTVSIQQPPTTPSSPIPGEVIPPISPIPGEVIPPTSPIPGEVIPPTPSISGEVIPPTPSIPGEITPSTSPVPGEITPSTSPVPGEITPSTSSVPGQITPTEPPIFAEPPQPLEIVPNLGEQPASGGLNTEPPGNVVKPGTQPQQGVNGGGGQTTSPSENQPAIDLEPLANLLSQILGTLSAQDLLLASQGKLLTNSQIKQLVQSARSWDRVKINYLSYPDLMRQIINYRTVTVFNTVTEVLRNDPQFRNLDVYLTNDEGVILGKLPEMVAAGSTDLTSDYDITFSSGAGNEGLEILAVEQFNQLFRSQWGLESGFVFDTNVYTSGHMRSEAFSGDGAKLSLVNKIAKKLKDIEETGNPLTEDQRAEINKLVAKINGSTNVEIKTTLAPLEANNLRTFAIRVRRLLVALSDKVREQYKTSKEAYGAGSEFDELATVMSLVHMREFWNQGQSPSGNWTYVEQRMTSEQVPEAVRNINQERLQLAQTVHTQLVEERNARKQLLQQQSPNEPETNIEMKANNQLYVEYLHRVQVKLVEIQGASPENVRLLKLQLQELQSKALFFANEAYMTAIAAEQVVLNQQIGLNVELPEAQYLASINEQTAFVGEQIFHIEHLSHSEGSDKISLPFGRSLWKTAKYIDRLLTAIETIHNQTGGLAPTPEVMERVSELRPPVSTLLYDIKKGKFPNDEQRDLEAETLGLAKSSVLGSNTSELRQLILDLQIDVNLQVQQYLNTNKVP